MTLKFDASDYYRLHEAHIQRKARVKKANTFSKLKKEHIAALKQQERLKEKLKKLEYKLEKTFGMEYEGGKFRDLTNFID